METCGVHTESSPRYALLSATTAVGDTCVCRQTPDLSHRHQPHQDIGDVTLRLVSFEVMADPKCVIHRPGFLILQVTFDRVHRRGMWTQWVGGKGRRAHHSAGFREP
jgi:hypothetical protein